MVKRYFSKEQKIKYVNDWKLSNLSKTEYCRRSNITPSAFSNWVVKFGVKDTKVEASSKLDLIDITPKMVAKQVLTSQPSIVITTKSGTRLEFYL